MTVARTADAVGEEISHALLTLTLSALVLLVVMGVAGLLLASRLSRPFQALAEQAGQIRTRPEPLDPGGSAIPEARRIGAALTGSATQLAQLRAREQTLAAHVSHELRTPLTRLRLDLEDLALWPDLPANAAAQIDGSLAHLDQLDDVIEEILDLTRRGSLDLAINLDLEALVAATVSRLRQRGFEVTAVPTGRYPTLVDPVVVEELLDAVVRRLAALKAGALVVRVADRGTHLEITVQGVEVGSLPWTTDAEWDRAVEVAAATGGQLVRTLADPAEVVVRLPKRPGRD